MNNGHIIRIVKFLGMDVAAECNPYFCYQAYEEGAHKSAHNSKPQGLNSSTLSLQTSDSPLNFTV